MSILNHWPDDPRAQAMWAFDHANAHITLVKAMGPNGTGFSLAAYLLDPMPPGAADGASSWDMYHQQAHDDAAAYFSVEPSLPLIDSDSEVHGQFQQWLFINSQEHIVLEQAALVTGLV